MVRLKYYISFTVLYIAFSVLMIWLLGFKKKITIGTYYSAAANHRIKDILFAFIMIYIAAIKMNFGSDYWSYSLIYNRALTSYSGIPDIFEQRGILGSGLYVVAYILKSFTHSIGWDTPIEHNFIFIVCSIISTWAIIVQIRKHSENYQWSMAIYFLMGYFMIANNILKQQIAMVFLLFAYDALLEKKNVKYVCLCLFACLFHVTAIFPTLLFPLVIKIKMDKRAIYIFVGICLAITASLPVTMRFFANASFLGYTKYFENFATYSQASVGKTYAIGSFIAYMIIFICAYKFKDLLFKNDYISYSYLALLSAGLIINALAFNFWLLIRVSLYFYQFVIFLVPNIISQVNPSRRQLRYIKVALIVFAAFYVLYSWDNHYFAFHTIYNEGMEPAYLDYYISMYE